MFKITLKNGKSFNCDSSTTIFDAAKTNGIVLEHSCLSARCRSCIVRIEAGTSRNRLEELILSSEEKLNNWVLSCNAIPTSNIILDVEDLNEIQFFEKRIIPAKIQAINYLNQSVIEVVLRLPPGSNFLYNSGQYVNIIKGANKRSYSIANACIENNLLTFFIKKNETGLMSKYWFDIACVNDVLRIEGPLGSFFLRDNHKQNIIFLATGTGVAPIKSILESLNNSFNEFKNKKDIWVFVGARYESDLFWEPSELSVIHNIKYVPVLSRASKDWMGEKGYVQDVVIEYEIPLKESQVYACGSNSMIESAKKLFIEKGLDKNYFFSDAFIQSN